MNLQQTPERSVRSAVARPCRPALAAAGFLAVLLAGLCLAAAPAAATDRHVPADYPTIQAAFTAAVNGDTIYVAAGTYTGTGTAPVVFWSGKNIALVGAGAATTIIDGENVRPCLYLDHVPATARLEGFTVTRGKASDGGGVFLAYSSPTLEYNAFDSNQAVGCGGGVFVLHSSPTLTNNTFSGNSVTGTGGGGGGMWLDDSAALLANNTFSGNSATSSNGGGVFLFQCTSTTVTSNTFSDNSAYYGGGLYLYQSPSPTLADNTLSGNSATDGGGVYLYDSSPALVNNTFSGNSAASSGGGMLLAYSSAVLTNNTFSGNSASGGGGVFLNGSSLTLMNCILWGSVGGSIFTKSGSASVSYSDVEGGVLPGAGNLSVDPGFVDAPNGDLHLQPGSPCAGAGTAAGAPATDKDGVVRPYPPSIGAYEGDYAKRLAFTSGPGNANAGAAIPVQVTVYDQNDAVATWFSGQVTLSVKSGPGALGGTYQGNASAGVATLSPALVTPGTYVLTATAGAAAADSSAFEVHPLLVFTSQPTASLLMASIAPAVEVAVVDSLGNPVAGRTDAITLALAGGPAGARLYGTATVSAVDGVATFADLRLNRLGGGYRLAASSGTLAGVTSSAFSVVSGAPATLRFVSQPAGGKAGAAMPAFQVEVLDGRGLRVTTGTQTVRLSLYRNPGRAVLSGATANTVAGVATFDGVTLSKAGAGYVLNATALRVSGAKSDAFAIAP